jgi:hypothetical protein
MPERTVFGHGIDALAHARVHEAARGGDDEGRP